MNEEKKHFLKSHTNWTVINIFPVNSATFSLLPIWFSSVRLLLMLSASHNRRLCNSLISFCSVDLDYIFFPCFFLLIFVFLFSSLSKFFPLFIWFDRSCLFSLSFDIKSFVLFQQWSANHFDYRNYSFENDAKWPIARNVC